MPPENYSTNNSTLYSMRILSCIKQKSCALGVCFLQVRVRVLQLENTLWSQAWHLESQYYLHTTSTCHLIHSLLAHLRFKIMLVKIQFKHFNSKSKLVCILFPFKIHWRVEQTFLGLWHMQKDILGSDAEEGEGQDRPIKCKIWITYVSKLSFSWKINAKCVF